MKITYGIKLNLKIPEVKNKVIDAARKSLLDTIVDIANDAIKGSPKLTGNNMRSIKYEIGDLSGAVFSTSGYGGFLETGTRFMRARPYFKPALDRNIHKLPDGIKARLK